MQRNIEMLSRVVELAGQQGLYICLVVDEANLAFPTLPLAKPQKPEDERMVADTRLLLERIVQLTKQSCKINALIVSSEYGYPYRLQHDNFFNITNLTDTLFAGEVPPAEMRVLLQEVWGLGPELSDVFLAYYGGHVHLASQALTKLTAMLDQFKCKSVAPKGAAGAIARCLEADASGDKRRMLHAMALKGFAPIVHEGNAQAQALSQANLGGVIDTDATVVGLPWELRTGENYGIVPSSNFIVSVVHNATSN